MGRRAGGVRMPKKSVETPSKGTPPKENQGGRGQQKRNFQVGPAVTPRVICGYYNKSNHTEAECWRK